MKSIKLNHKFRFACLLTLLFCSISGFTQNTASKKINFIEDSWTQALKKAKAENKYIFVDAYASWCGPCKELKETTFKNPKAAEFFNKQFVNLTIDTEKGQGVDLANKWGLESYPTLYIFDSKGKMVLQSDGFLTAQELIAFGQRSLNKYR